MDEKQQKAQDKAVAAAVKGERQRVLELIKGQVEINNGNEDKATKKHVGALLKQFSSDVKVGPGAPAAA